MLPAIHLENPLETHVIKKRSLDQQLRIKLYYDESVYRFNIIFDIIAESCHIPPEQKDFMFAYNRHPPHIDPNDYGSMPMVSLNHFSNSYVLSHVVIKAGEL